MCIRDRKETEKSTWFSLLLDILKEPMLILLIIITLIYLIVGNYGEAAFMFFAIVAVSGISFYQDNRSKKALEELEKLNAPLSKVIRNSKIISIPTHETVSYTHLDVYKRQFLRCVDFMSD